MKSKKQVIEERPDYKKLINAVLNSIDEDDIENINNHGIDGGYGKFVYYSDTVTFYKKHKADIKKLAQEMAQEMGENVIEMIGGFNCLKYFDYKNHKWTDLEGQDVIGETFYGNKYDDVVANALAWFAGEEVCRWFEE